MTDNHQTSPPKCVKELGCACRHKLRWYVHACNARTTPQPYLDWSDPPYQNNFRIESDELYKLTQCNCCERHTTKRPTWDELVRLCPALKNKPTININVSAKTTKTEGGRIVHQEAKANMNGNQFGDGAVININTGCSSNNGERVVAASANVTTGDPQLEDDELDELPPLMCRQCGKYTHRGGKDYREDDGSRVAADYKLCACSASASVSVHTT